MHEIRRCFNKKVLLHPLCIGHSKSQCCYEFTSLNLYTKHQTIYLPVHTCMIQFLFCPGPRLSCTVLTVSTMLNVRCTSDATGIAAKCSIDQDTPKPCEALHQHMPLIVSWCPSFGATPPYPHHLLPYIFLSFPCPHIPPSCSLLPYPHTFPIHIISPSSQYSFPCFPYSLFLPFSPSLR